MRTALVALLGALTLAGCLGGDAPAAPAATDDAAVPDAAQDAPLPDAVAQNATDLAPQVLPIELEGSLRNYAVVCGEPVGCHATPADASSRWMQETPGKPLALAVEMSWSARSPATQELALVANACWETEEGGITCEAISYVTGASPLTLALEALDVPDNAVVRVFGHMPSMLPDSPLPMWAHVELEQPYTLAGELRIAPAPADAAAS